MTSKYDDFLLEKTIITLINEGELTGSSNFLDRVDRIRKNKIANTLKFLFNGFDTSDDLPQNYVDVDGEDKITFLSDVKADKIFSDGHYDTSRPFLAKGRNSVKIGRFVKTLFKNKEQIIRKKVKVLITVKFPFFPIHNKRVKKSGGDFQPFVVEYSNE